MVLQRGFRDRLEKYADPAGIMSVVMKINGSAVYDYCCFGVDAAGKLSDDRYMVFYNQTRSPAGEICYAVEGAGAKFDIALSKLPASIVKLVFTVSIDGSGNMGSIGAFSLNVLQGGRDVASLSLSGCDFHEERAIIAIEIYKKDVWRIAVVAGGYNGGLSDLLRDYGGQEVDYPEDAPAAPATPPRSAPAAPATPPRSAPVIPAVPPRSAPAAPATPPRSAPVIPATPPRTVSAAPAAPKKVSLEKKLEKSAPQLVSLAKPLQVELKKRKLEDVTARVALVLDISGSMVGQYDDGTVQEIVNKVLPLAVHFDDDGELDFWYYGKRCRRMPSVNMGNYTTAVPWDWDVLMDSLGYCNDEPVVMREVIAEYQRSRVPAYILFITDGGVVSERAISKLLKEASHVPIFWQFVGVGGSGYGILERLDNMRGRYVDNANFFAIDDFRSVGNSELYSRLLNEFPQWLQEIRRKGMI